MKIAVTYQAGRVFQHFGQTKTFEVYEIDEFNMSSRALLDSNGASHGELVEVLKDNGISILICGGIGTHAIERLKNVNIEVFPGIEGSSEDAVKRYLNGELKPNMSAIHVCSHH